LFNAQSFDLFAVSNSITGLDPIRVETAPSHGAVQKIFLPKAAGSAFGDLRQSLWSVPF